MKMKSIIFLIFAWQCLFASIAYSNVVIKTSEESRVYAGSTITIHVKEYVDGLDGLKKSRYLATFLRGGVVKAQREISGLSLQKMLFPSSCQTRRTSKGAKATSGLPRGVLGFCLGVILSVDRTARRSKIGQNQVKVFFSEVENPNKIFEKRVRDDQFAILAYRLFNVLARKDRSQRP